MKNLEETTREHIIRRIESDTAIDPPEDTVGYVSNLYRTRCVEPKKSVVRRLLAALSFDLTDQPAFGERSAAVGQSRQMLFDTADNAVNLKIATVSNGFDICGQVFGDGFEGAEVIVANEQNSFEAHLDEQASFKLTSIPAGSYSLSIRSDESEIFVEALSI